MDDPLYREILARVDRAHETDPSLADANDHLASLFTGILREMHGERKFDDKELLEQVERVKVVLRSITGETPTDSRLPGGSTFHRLIQKLTRRQVQGLAAQVQSLFVVQQQLLETLISREIVQQQRETRLVRVLSQHVMDRLATVEYLERELRQLKSQISPIDASRRDQ